MTNTKLCNFQRDDTTDMMVQNGGEVTQERVPSPMSTCKKLEAIKENMGDECTLGKEHRNNETLTIKIKDESSLTSETQHNDSSSQQTTRPFYIPSPAPHRNGYDTEDSISNAYATYDDNDAMSNSHASRKSKGSFERRNKIKKRKSRFEPREVNSLKSSESGSTRSVNTRKDSVRSTSASRKSNIEDQNCRLIGGNEEENCEPPFPSLMLPGGNRVNKSENHSDSSRQEDNNNDGKENSEGKRFIFWMDLSIIFVGALIVCTTIAIRMLGSETDPESSETPDTTPALSGSWYCGKTFVDASENCDIPCAGGDNTECPVGMHCFEGVSECEINGGLTSMDNVYISSFCGPTRDDAAQFCDKPCPRGNIDCMIDEECYENIDTCGGINATAPIAYVSNSFRYLRRQI